MMDQLKFGIHNSKPLKLLILRVL